MVHYLSPRGRHKESESLCSINVRLQMDCFLWKWSSSSSIIWGWGWEGVKKQWEKGKGQASSFNRRLDMNELLPLLVFSMLLADEGGGQWSSNAPVAGRCCWRCRQANHELIGHNVSERKREIGGEWLKSNKGTSTSEQCYCLSSDYNMIRWQQMTHQTVNRDRD